jgi:hypothetical protein
MNASTRRVIRTAYQVVAAIVLAAPLIIGVLPEDVSNEALIVGFGAWVTTVARIINTLEDHGYIPSWLKDEA